MIVFCNCACRSMVVGIWSSSSGSDSTATNSSLRFLPLNCSCAPTSMVQKAPLPGSESFRGTLINALFRERL